ncbi:MAG TPA: tyrosine-type recombinase/integrase [Polyangiales bacterium]
MAQVKLTKRVVEAAKPETAEYTLWDAEIKGFGLKVTPTGKKNYLLYYRATDGTQRKPKIGGHGALTVDQARAIARSMLAAVAAGADPSAARQAARTAPTVADLCTIFEVEHVGKKKGGTSSQYKTILKNYIRPALGSRKVGSITRDDMAQLVSKIGKEKPVAANRTKAVASVMFKLAERWGLRPLGSNPCQHIDRFKEKKLHRDLSELELARLASVLSDAEAEPEPGRANVSEKPDVVAAIRLIMFTGCRRNEVANLRWDEVDLERGLLRLRDSKTGPKTIQTNRAALDIIEAQERPVGAVYVFPEAKKPGRLNRSWERIRTRAQLGDMRLHDLRHNFASAAAGSGASLVMIGKLLGHGSSATTERYAQLRDDPAKQASEAAGAAISAAMAKKPGLSVVK